MEPSRKLLALSTDSARLDKSDDDRVQSTEGMLHSDGSLIVNPSL